MSRGIRVVLHAVIAESLKMPNSCFAVYSTMSVCKARVHILRSLKSLYHLMFMSACQGLCISIVFSDYVGAPLNPSTNVYTQIENVGCQIADK